MEKTKTIYREDVSETDVREIDFTEIMVMLVSRWKLILLSAIICGLLVFVWCRFYVTPQYASTSGLYVFSKSTSVTSLTDLQIGTSLTTDYETVITSRPVLERVITRLDLEESFEELKSKLTVSNPSDSRILYITCTDPDPEKAKEIVDRIASIGATFISQKMDQDPPSIIQTGYSDGSPVSPMTGRDCVIGALIGLSACAFYIILTSLLNDSIMTPEDVRDKLGLDVLASLPLEVNEDRDKRGRKGFFYKYRQKNRNGRTGTARGKRYLCKSA